MELHVLEAEPDLVQNLRDILALDGLEIVPSESVLDPAEGIDWSRLGAVLVNGPSHAGADRLLLPRAGGRPSESEVEAISGDADLLTLLDALRGPAALAARPPIDPPAFRRTVARLLDRPTEARPAGRRHPPPPSMTRPCPVGPWGTA
jgi:hypothetical protein